MTRVGINGFGRIGRLAARALRNHRSLELAHVNELHADAATAAHLFEFDTVHGRYPGVVSTNGEAMSIDGNDVTFSRAATPADIDWSAAGVDIVIEASGKFKTVKTLKPHLKNGASSVIVAAPVKDDAVLNVVIGCNDDLYSPTTYPIATAASCTTNSIAPVVKLCMKQLASNAERSPRSTMSPTPKSSLMPLTKIYVAHALRSTVSFRRPPAQLRRSR